MSDILVKVGADISNFSKGMSDAAKQASDMGRATEKGTLTIGKLVAAVGGIKALSAGFNMVKNSIGKAFNRIDTMEQFDRVMTTMTGSSKKAAQVLDTVNDTVKGTAYGLDVAAKSTQQFVTSGMDVDKATDSISAWGDAVAFYGDGSNESFASVTDALAKMTGKGKVQMDTMNRLVEAGIPAMEIYADATGQSTEEVAAQMQKGELDAEKFMDVMNDALMNGTESFAGIEGAAKEAGASWGAAFDNMGAAVARGVTSIIESIDEMLANNGLPSMRGMVAEFGTFFEETLKKVAEGIPNVIEAIQGWKESLEPIKPLIIGIVASIGIMATVSAVFGTIRGLINGLTASVGLLGRSFGIATLPMMAIIAVTALVGAAVYELWQTNEEFRANVQIIWEHIQTIFSTVLETISSAVVGFIGVLVELINIMMPVIAYVTEVVASFLGWIVSIIETNSWITQIISGLSIFLGVAAAVVGIVAAVVKVFMVVFNAIRIVVGVVRIVMTAFTAFMTPVGWAIMGITALGGVLVWLGDKFEWIGNVVDTVSSWISDAWSGFLDFLGFGTKEAANDAGVAIEGLSDTAASSTSQMAETTEENVGAMNDTISTEFADMNQYGSMQMSNLNMTGTSELDSLYASGSGSMTDLSADTQAMMDDMALGSIDSVDGMNTDITKMLADLESSGSVDIESLSNNVTSDLGDMSSLGISDVSDLASTGASDFSGMESDITSSASNMQTSVKASFEGMSASIKSEMAKIGNISNSALKGISSDFESSMSKISSTIKKSMSDVAKATQDGMRKVSQSARVGMQQTNTAVTQGSRRMYMTLSQSLNRMITAYTRGYMRLVRITTSNMNRIVSVTKSGMNSATNAFVSGMNRNAASAQSTSTRIVSIFGRLHSQLRIAGGQAMAGLRNGLNAGASNVMATARNIANNVATTMRTALKIHSPSRITMAIGKFTGEGVAVGLDKTMALVTKAATRMADAAVPDIDMSYDTPDGAFGSLKSAVSGAVSVNTSSRDRALIGAINGLRRDMTNLRVEMEGETVGRLTRRHINEGNAKDEVGRYFG